MCDFNERMRECQQTVDACKKRIEELLENPSVLRSPLGGDKEQPVVGSLN